jgi:hypothetical protein
LLTAEFQKWMTLVKLGANISRHHDRHEMKVFLMMALKANAELFLKYHNSGFFCGAFSDEAFPINAQIPDVWPPGDWM